MGHIVLIHYSGILYHYVEFDTCIINMLEKLLGVGSYGGYIGHLICS